MRQSRVESAVESVLNVGSGYVIGALVWAFVIAPLWGYRVTPFDTLAIPAMFTGISVLRSYIWRRVFERRIRRRFSRVTRPARRADPHIRHWG